MSEIDVNLKSSFDSSGTSAATKAFAALQEARNKANQASSAASANDGNAKLAASAQKAATEVIKAEAAFLRAARAEATLASASGNTAGAIAGLSGALQQVDRSSLAAVGAQTQLARALNQTASSGEALPRTFAGFTDEVAGAAAGMLSFGAVLGAGQQAIESFQQAFDFKANLDATTASINIQLQGVRDSGQVWNEAAAYAQKYKLTQAETTSTVQASIGILRSSKSSIEETFGVLQRLTVLAPGKTIEDAAFSVRELASGDIMSIADQFNISRQKAYEMRDAIANGADVVSVLSGFLDQSGVSMDSLKVKTEGALGAQKDLAIAQEQMKLAQAELAAGPGLAILNTQIEVVRGATRLLSGDFQSMGASLTEVGHGGSAQFNGIAQAFGVSRRELELLTQGLQQYQKLAADSRGDAQARSSRGGNRIFADGAAARDQEAAATQNQANADAQAAQRAEEHATASTKVADAAAASGAEIAKELEKKQQNTAQTELLKQAQTDLAALGGSVAGGMQTAGQAALALASKYNIAYAEALKLINAQAALAGASGQARLNAQAAQTRTLGTANAASPGRTSAGSGDVDSVVAMQKATQDAAIAQRKYNEQVGGSKVVLAGLRNDLNNANLTEAQRIDILTKIASAEGKAASAGGARASAAEGIARKLVDIEQGAADKIVAINQKMIAQQEAAARQLAGSIATTTADMISAQEADDLDLIGAKEENIAKLQSRESAQASARIAQAAAVSEAQATAAAGDAETADKVLSLREASIGRQMSLDEEYNNRKIELADDPTATAALKQQYDEATQAAQDATAVRVGLAQAEADQKAQAAETEKQAVIDQAAKAGEALSDTGKKANASAGQVKALTDALHSIPTNITTTITVKQVGDVGSAKPAGGTASAAPSSGTVKGAGGGQFITSGPTHFTVGDNPGGVEAVSVVPLSGAGHTSMSGNVAKMAGGGTAIVESASDAARKALEEANRRAIELAGATSTKTSKGGGGVAGGAAAAAADDPTAAIDKALSVLDKIASLREKLKDIGPPLDEALINQLADEAQKATQIMGQRFTLIAKSQGDNFDLFTKAEEDAISVLDKAAGLRNQIKDIGPPLDMATIDALADEALAATKAIRARWIPIAKSQGEQIDAYVKAAGASIGLLADAGKLTRKAFSDYLPPTDAEINQFALDANRVTSAIAKAASAYGTKGLEAAGSFADVTGKVFDTIGKGLETFDKIRFGDLSVDPKNLKLLEQSTLAILDTTQTIAARAAQIPTADLAALGLATQAINDQASALVNLAAVPFGNLSGASQGYSQSNTSSIGAINIYATPGMDVNALANLVSQRIQAQSNANRR